MSIGSVMLSNHLILCCSLLLPPSIFPSIRVFSNESVLRIRWPKYWNFSFSISPSNEYSGLISFRMDWLDLLAVQGTLLQHRSSRASVLWHSAFFIVQLSHPYLTTAKTIALTRRTFVGKVMSLLFNMLSRLVIAFLLALSTSDIFPTSWDLCYLIGKIEITLPSSLAFQGLSRILQYHIVVCDGFLVMSVTDAQAPKATLQGPDPPREVNKSCITKRTRWPRTSSFLCGLTDFCME